MNRVYIYNFWLSVLLYSRLPLSFSFCGGGPESVPWFFRPEILQYSVGLLAVLHGTDLGLPSEEKLLKWETFSLCCPFSKCWPLTESAFFGVTIQCLRIVVVLFLFFNHYCDFYCLNIKVEDHIGKTKKIHVALIIICTD